MKRCNNCGRKIIFGGYPVENHIFCSKDCKEEFTPSEKEFCELCLAETIAIDKIKWRAFLLFAAAKVYDDVLFSNNLRLRFGPEFGPLYKNRCPKCGSVIAKLWICFFIPIIPLNKYRILYRKNALSHAESDIEVRKFRIQQS